MRSTRGKEMVCRSPMGSIIEVDPHRCRVWRLHQRLGTQVNLDTCSAEIVSFQEHGQLVPALGRCVADGSECEIELIYGARRLFVARHLGQQLLVDVRDISDRDGIIAMDIENRLRKDISPYERGLGYARWLRSGQFESQDEMARSLGVSASQVSRLLRIARLPAVVLAAFRTAGNVCENWGLEIMDALDDPLRRQATIRCARQLGDVPGRLPGDEVYRKLITSSVRGRKPRIEPHDRVVLGDDGTALFRVRYQSNTIVMMLPSERVSIGSLQEIEGALLAILSPIIVFPALPNDRGVLQQHS
jgi:ParB family chromosome partitioning protein